MNEYTYQERITMIKEIAERQKRMRALKNKGRIAQKYVDENPREKSKVKDYDEGESMIHWADESKYVNEHYGERAREQRTYESDWG